MWHVITNLAEQPDGVERDDSDGEAGRPHLRCNFKIAMQWNGTQLLRTGDATECNVMERAALECNGMQWNAME